MIRERVLLELEGLSNRIQWIEQDLRKELDRFYSIVENIQESETLAKEVYSMEGLTSNINFIMQQKERIEELSKAKRCLEFILKDE